MTLYDASNMFWMGPVLALWMAIMQTNNNLNISKEIHDFWEISP